MEMYNLFIRRKGKLLVERHMPLNYKFTDESSKKMLILKTEIYILRVYIFLTSPSRAV